MKDTKPFLVVDDSQFTITQFVDENGTFCKEVKTTEALRLAQQVGLDLVCFAINLSDQPPLCKLIDYGKWKYKNDKKRKIKTNKKHEVKEVRFSPVIQINDIEHKVKHIKDFIEEGHEINITMRLKRRQRVDLAKEMMDCIVDRCEEFASVIMRKNDQKFLLVKITKKKTKTKGFCS